MQKDVSGDFQPKWHDDAKAGPTEVNQLRNVLRNR